MDLHLPTPAGELTRAEQKILDYINTNTDTFLFLSIGQLAERLGPRSPASPAMWVAGTSRR